MREPTKNGRGTFATSFDVEAKSKTSPATSQTFQLVLCPIQPTTQQKQQQQPTSPIMALRPTKRAQPDDPFESDGATPHRRRIMNQSQISTRHVKICTFGCDHIRFVLFVFNANCTHKTRSNTATTSQSTSHGAEPAAEETKTNSTNPRYVYCLYLNCSYYVFCPFYECITNYKLKKYHKHIKTTDEHVQEEILEHQMVKLHNMVDNQLMMMQKKIHQMHGMSIFCI